MSIKSTRHVTRQRALDILTTEIEYLPNDVLGDMLDVIADSKQSRIMSYFDNFIVSDFAEDEA